MPRLPFVMVALGLLPSQLFALEPRVTIRSDFSGGNVVVLANEPGAVRIAPDLRGSRDWFYWYCEVQAGKPGTVTFSLPDAPKLGARGPAISRDGGKTWGWLAPEQVKLAPPGAKAAEKVDRFTVHFTQAGETVRLAVTIPYGQVELDAFIAKFQRNPHFHTEILTHTRTGRKPVELLRVGEPAAGRSAILLTARHHACETIASFVLEGFLAEALSDSPAAIAFRKQHVLYAVPMVDKDGVLAGDQGKNRPPHDHNRDYGPDAIYPEIRAIMELAERADIRHALDLHCPFIRGDIHEAFHFLGLSLPHIRDNLNDWIFWIQEERPRSATAPINLLVDSAKPNAQNPRMNSHHFALRKNAMFAATLEIPYAQKPVNLDPALARAYGASLLRSWLRTGFIARGETRTAGASRKLQALRGDFQRLYRGRPREAERLLQDVLDDPAAPPVLRNEAEVLRANLYLSGKDYSSANKQAVRAAAIPTITAQQRETATLTGVRATCANPKSTALQVDTTVAATLAAPFVSNGFRASVLEAAADFHARHNDSALSLGYLQQLREAVPLHDEGRVMNRIAQQLELLNRSNEAQTIRKEAVRILRSRLDPMPKGVFGANMCGDLLDALTGIPTSTPAERRQAAEQVLAHPVSHPDRKTQAQKVIATLKAATTGNP